MKKIILTAVALLGMYGISTASIYVLKQDGGASGYKTVSEVHDDNGNSSLSCKDPGNETCAFTVAPSNGIYHAAISFVEGEITKGNTNGSTILDGNIVKWNGTDVFNYSMNVDKVNP